MKCEATTNPSFFWIPNKIEFRNCTNGATIEIDGLKLCRQHAGIVALQKLVNSKEAKIIKNSYSPVCGMDRFSKNLK